MSAAVAASFVVVISKGVTFVPEQQQTGLPATISAAVAEREIAIRRHAAEVLERCAQNASWVEGALWVELWREAKAYRQNRALGPVLLSEVAGLTEPEIDRRCLEIEAEMVRLCVRRGEVIRARNWHLSELRKLAAAVGVTASDVAGYDFSAGSVPWPVT